MRNIRLYNRIRRFPFSRLAAAWSRGKHCQYDFRETLRSIISHDRPVPGAFLCIQDRDGSTCLRSDGEFPYGLHTSYDGNPSLPEPISSI